jgi:sugar phosphate isomerase/epimerase
MIKLHLQTLSYKNTVLSGERDLHGMIDLAAGLGFDGIDFEDRQFTSTGDDHLEAVRLHALRRGLNIGYIGVIGGFGGAHHGGDEGHFRHICRWIDVCAQMGVPLVRLIGGNIPAGKTDETAWPWLAGWLRRVTDYARARRVLVGLHNHNHGMFPATGPQVLRMLDEINDPYFTHIVDTGQYRGSPGASGGPARRRIAEASPSPLRQAQDDASPAPTGHPAGRGDVDRAGSHQGDGPSGQRVKGRPDAAHDFYDYIRQTAPRAIAARAKIYRIRSGEEEWIDYRRVLPILKGAGFNGPLSIVFEGWDDLDEREAVPKAAAFLRRLLHEHGM